MLLMVALAFSLAILSLQNIVRIGVGAEDFGG